MRRLYKILPWLMLLAAWSITYHESTILPSSVYTEIIQFNGQQSTQQTMTFTCSDTNPSGTLIVGNYLLDITCNAPEVDYRITELTTIPQSVVLMQNLACYATDAEAFQQAFQNSKQSFLSNIQDVSDSYSGNSNRRLLSTNARKLLAVTLPFGEIIDVAEEGGGGGFLGKLANIGVAIIATTALAIGIENTKQINVLHNQVDAINDEVASIATQVNKIDYVEIPLIQATDRHQGEQIQSLFYGVGNLSSAVGNLQLGLNITNQNLQTLAAGTDKYLTQLRDQIHETQLQTAAAINSGNNITHQAILSLADATVNSLQVLQSSMSKIQANLEIQIQNTNSMMANQEDVQSDRSLLAVLNQLVYDMIEALDSNYNLFTTDQGVSPGQLTGVDLRNTQESVYINYVTPTLGNSTYEIHSVRMRFYLDTYFGFQQQRQYGSQVILPNTITTYFTTPDCQRSYVPPNQTPDPFNNVTCSFWVEVEDIYCVSNLTPKQYWTNTSVLDIPVSSCNVGAIATQSIQVLKTFDQFLSYVANLCGKRGSDVNSQFMLIFLRVLKGGLFDPPRTSDWCNAAWDTQFEQTSGSDSTLLRWLWGGMYGSWSLANVDLSNKRLKRYGNTPGGIDIEILPHYHLPVGYNATTGEAIYSGSATPTRCLRSNYVAVHQNTLPIYMKQIVNSENAVYKSISVKVSGYNNYTCTDASSCYNVGTNLITSNIIYSSDRLPEEQGVFLGSLNAAVVQSQQLYDVPETQLMCNPNNRANENSLCYLSFAAGVRSSWSLNKWSAYHGIQDFKPKEATISASDYRVRAVFDDSGTPMCANALNSDDVANITTDAYNCNLPYKYSNITLPNLSTSTSSNQLPTECLQAGTVTLFQSFLDTQHQSIFGTSALSFINPSGATPALFSLWFQSPIIVSDPGAGHELVVLEIKGVSTAAGTKYLRFLIDNNGRAAVVISSSATTSNTGLTLDTRVVAQAGQIITPNLRDGVLHYIVFQATVNNYNSGSGTVLYEIWVDNIYQGSYLSATGAYLRSDSAPVYFESALMISEATISNADSIRLGLINPNVNNVRLTNSYSCQQAYINKRCVQPAGAERLIIARQNVTDNNNIFCDSTSKLVLSTTGFDALFPQGVVSASQLFRDSSWSIGFWIRLPALVPVTGDYILLKNVQQSFRITFNSATQFLDISLNGVVASSINVQDSLTHYIVVAYTGSNAITYLDGHLFGAAVAIAPGSTGTSVSSSVITPNLNYVTMLKYYSGAVTNDGVVNEMKCQIDSSLSVNSFIPPLGFCEVSTIDATHGYCRSPLLCGGHCIAYGVIDSTSRTFTASTRSCDSGYSLNSGCTKKCARIDSTTGICIDVVSPYASAPIPLGRMCNDLYNNRVTMNTATNILTQIARKWLYSTTINIPSGIITSVIGSASCPKITLNSYGNTGRLLATFANLDSVETNIRVYYGPTAYLNNPNDVECNPSCCNFNSGQGVLYSIPGGVSNSLIVPACGQNMTIIYSRLTAVSPAYVYTPCATLQGDSLQLAVASGNALQSSTSLISIQTIVDQSALNLFRIQQNMAVTVMDALLLAAGLQNATTTQLAIYKSIRDNFANATVFNYDTSDLTFNLTALVQPGIDQVNQALIAVKKSIEAADQANALIPVLQILIDALQRNLTVVVEEVNNSLLGSLFRLNMIKAMGGGADFNLGDLFNDAVSGVGAVGKALTNFVAGTVKEAVDAGKDLIHSAMDGIFGSGSLLGSFFSTAINVVVLAAIGYAIYFVVTKTSLLEKCKSNNNNAKNKQRNKKLDDPVSEDTTRLVPQSPTESRFYSNTRSSSSRFKWK